MDFPYTPLFQLGQDPTPYHLPTRTYVETIAAAGRRILSIDPEGLRLLAREAMREIAFFLPPGHLAQLTAILDDPAASDNDRYVAATLLRNAQVAAEQVLPSCQDTGTAIVVGHKGEQVWTHGDDAALLSRGIMDTYVKENLRYSQMAPISMFEEVNTGTNLPPRSTFLPARGRSTTFCSWPRGAVRPTRPFSSRRPKRC